MGSLSRGWTIAGGIFFLFGALALWLSRALGTSGTSAWVLRLSLLLLGAVASGLVLLIARSRARREAQSQDVGGADDISSTITSAQNRLAAARLSSQSRIDRLPLALVFGPGGSTKTSVLLNSGLDAELLAGEVLRGDNVTPTEPLNVWYAQGAILVEAGGRLLDDADRWSKLLKYLHPSRLAAAIGRGKQAPRMAVLCFGVDELLQPGASQRLAASARVFRDRLGEASRQLGIRLPVYVLFTRSDRIPYFADYVRNLSTQEVQQVLGATLPLSSESGTVWAEQESRRLNDAFARLVESLALRRLDVLPREAQESLRANAYEFPRELHKIVEPAVQFLLDVFRPNQLGQNPLLRGIYFTGVRPVMVRDSGGDVLARGAPGVESGATAVFSPAALQQAAQQVPRSSGERKVPQWVFVQRLFREVILRDDVAVRITAGGARVDILRRALIGTAAAACIFFAFAITFSWANNSAFVRQSKDAVEGALQIGSVLGSTLEQDLGRLDALRLQAERVTDWKNNGRPLSYKWGLFTGARLEPVLRNLYFRQFEQTLWNDTRTRIHQYLDELPAAPDENSDFGKAQDALAAYLVTTTEFKRSTGAELAPTLLSFWARGETSDSSRVIAERQFAFFARALAHENPYTPQTDAELVKKTQGFLRGFGPQAYYRVLVANANSSLPSRQYSGPAGYVRNDYVVPGAFTLDGFRNVQTRIDSVDALFARYEWIYGAPPEKPERAALVRLYETEYIRRWQNYLEAGSIADFSSPSDAAARLRLLADLNSPIVNMLAVASRETDMDSTSRIGRAFRPLLATVPPNDPRGPSANMVDYLSQLRMLSTQLGMLEGGSGDGARTAAESSREIGVRESSVAASFITGAEASVTAGLIQRFLTQPGARTLTLVTELPKAELNADARAFCETFRPLAGTYPFDPNGRDAPSRVISAIFQKGEGQLWSFYGRRLEPYFTAQGVLRSPAPRGERVQADFARFLLLIKNILLCI
jgi:type VI secretion system protein ImpL